MLASCSDAPLPTETWTPSDHDQPARRQVDPARVARPAVPEPEIEQPEGAAEERAAQALFNVMCSSCHGRNGMGDGPSAPGALVNFQDPAWQASRTDEELTSVIRLGRGMMPAFGERLVPAGIEALVAHVRRFGQGGGAGEAALPEAEGSEEGAGGESEEAEVPANEEPTEGQ